jgi:hypothetical protein
MSIPKKEANMTTKIICHDVFELVYELHTDNTSTMFCRKRESDAPPLSLQRCIMPNCSGVQKRGIRAQPTYCKRVGN